MLQPTITRHGPRLASMLAELEGIDAESLYPKDRRLLDAISMRCTQLDLDFEDVVAHVRGEQREEARLIRTRQIEPPAGRNAALLPEDAQVVDAAGRVR